MPLIQRNSLTFSNLVYSTGNYSNPQWITSLSPAKVGSGTAQWNASQLQGQNVSTGIPYTGAALAWNGQWMASGTPIPIGGLEGQIMSKGSDANYDIAWIDNYAPDIRIICKNDSGENISRGQAVMAVGATGDRIRIAKSVADGTVNPRYMLGLAFENINNGNEGYVTILGEITNLDTDAYNIGDILWLNPTTPGGFITTEPESPNVRMAVAIVTRKQQSSGRIFVRMWTQQPSIIDLKDVAINNPSSGQVLMYNSLSGVWQNSDIPDSGSSPSSYSAESGIILQGSTFVMGGTGQLNLLNFESSSSVVGHTGIIIKDSVNGFYNLENVFVGTDYLLNANNYQNIALGKYSMSYSSGDRNIAIGLSSFFNSVCIDSVGIGQDSCSNISNFSYSNIALGSYSLSSSSSIGFLVGIGESSLNSVNIGSRSVGIGYYAGALSNNIDNDVFLGNGAGSYSSGSGNIYIGYNAGYLSSGNNNLELLTGSTNSYIQGNSNKLNFCHFIKGDILDKKLSLGHIENDQFTPSAFFEILPSGDKSLLVSAPSGYSFDFLSLKVASENVFSIDCSGSISGQNANFNIISGALSPSIVQSTGLVLDNSFHGKIIEHTGISVGTYTLGSITNSSWQCMFVNYGGGIEIASGINSILSYSGYLNISDLYGSASIYRRPNGEFFLYGSIQ